MDNILITNQEVGKFEQREDGVYMSIFRESKDLVAFEDVVADRQAARLAHTYAGVARICDDVVFDPNLGAGKAADSGSVAYEKVVGDGPGGALVAEIDAPVGVFYDEVVFHVQGAACAADGVIPGAGDNVADDLCSRS